MDREKMCIDTQLDRIERMLKYIIIKSNLREMDKIIQEKQRIMPDPHSSPTAGAGQQCETMFDRFIAVRTKKAKMLPDISDILEEK